MCSRRVAGADLQAGLEVLCQRLCIWKMLVLSDGRLLGVEQVQRQIAALHTMHTSLKARTYMNQKQAAARPKEAMDFTQPRSRQSLLCPADAMSQLTAHRWEGSR